MKMLGRILIILLAAAIVIGGAYALLQTSTAQALVGQPTGQGNFEGQAGQPDFANGQTASLGEGRRNRESGGSWATVGRNLLEMVAIIGAVQVLWSIGRRLKRTGAMLARKNQLKVTHS